MDDFSSFEKVIVRELSCRLCLCNEVSKLKPLSAELKRKIKRLFDITVRADDYLPKAICHDCLKQVVAMHLYSIKVNKTQKYLDFHKQRRDDRARISVTVPILNETPPKEARLKKSPRETKPINNDQGDTRSVKPVVSKKVTPNEMKFLESLTMEEFANTEKLDQCILSSPGSSNDGSPKKITTNNNNNKIEKKRSKTPSPDETTKIDVLDPTVLINGRPARHGADLDKQITLFYNMECCICHERAFHFKSLMKHYKERHGVPGYLTCCNKKFHYFYPKRIIEHMAFHLQANIFMCRSCHHNFQSSSELHEHVSNGGRSSGKVLCPRCTDRYPTYRELGAHLVTHRTEKIQCDYCAKILKNHHRKKTVNKMENLRLCNHCIRTLRTIEKQEKDAKEKLKVKKSDPTQNQTPKFKKALQFSDEELSTEETD
ncbi:zinc finger protein weckle [Plutella xylostella]|uniref:zinc finger protein weckle n=1 Tax=Plutella xylostella TaxID=51655 RepID=UPI002032921D|nr:zinc finger protein weckle [Plutella xylostella]